MGRQVVMQSFEPPGPIGEAYLSSIHPMSIIMGPGGSGKTVASAVKGPKIATDWYPVCKDGVIRFKLTVLRSTYRDMARTALESWHHPRLFPEDHPFTVEYTGGIDRPVLHRLKWATIRQGSLVPVEFTAQFAAIGDAEPEQFAKGFETSGVWLNECDLFNERIPGLMFSRTGRNPSLDQFSPTDLDRAIREYRANLRSYGIERDDDAPQVPQLLWGDCNPPDFENWVVRWGIEEPEKHRLMRLFRQPSGLAPNAENRAGKTRAQYEQELETMTENDARRYVHGEPGYALDGRPVYADEFSLHVHRAEDFLKPVENLPVAIGMDAGGSPAAVIGQFLPTGQFRLQFELCADPGTGPTRFGRMLQELLLKYYPGIPVGEAWADPSSFYGADKAAGELSWVETVARIINVNIMPAPSNEPGLRHDAVRWYLGMIDARTPRMLIDPRCRRIIGGFAAHYKLTKQATAGATDRLAVAKNEYSHPHDALQYVLLGHGGRASLINNLAGSARPPNVVGIRSGATQKKPEKSIWDC